MGEEIVISVICNAYNHEGYIREALEGFVMQKTKVSFEILIHDDASTDKTAEIIREYEEKYPHLIKPIYQTENQYSKGVLITKTYQLPRVKGKYIAFCEGDDYWTDEYKLQKQYEAMEAHPEVDMCVHNAEMIAASTKKVIRKFPNFSQDCILTAEQVIDGGGGYVATNSIFYRADLEKISYAFRDFLNFDYTMQIQGALRGGMLYLKDTMSVYRYMTVGSWTVREAMNVEKAEKSWKRIAEMLRILDGETEGRYHDIIEEKILMNEISLLKQKGEYKAVFQKKYKKVLKRYPLKSRLKLRIAAAFPWIISLKRKLKGKNK